MGWNTIKYACGHAEQRQMYGKISERDRLAEYLGRSKCPACAAAEAASKSAATGLPALKGSDKQIAWAQQIRAAKLAAIPAVNADGSPIGERAAAAIAALKARSDAKWWIDNRDCHAQSLLKMMLAGD